LHVSVREPGIGHRAWNIIKSRNVEDDDDDDASFEFGVSGIGKSRLNAKRRVFHEAEPAV
jgi:hypothetical protein